MVQQSPKALYVRTGRPVLRVFAYGALFALVVTLIQPLAAYADDAGTTTTITDADNTTNPAQQHVDAGSPDTGTTVTSDNTYTATPHDPNTPAPNTDPLVDPNPPANDNTIDQTNQVPPQDPNQTPSTTDTNASTQTTTTVHIINTNDLDVKTISNNTADTGNNNTSAGGDIRNSHTDTGDVNVYANVLTVANINLVNSQIVEMNNSFNQLANDLYLNQPELSPGERTQDLVAPLCGSQNMSCQSITTVKLSNTNTGSVENDVNLNANSGGNQITADGDARDNSIKTGKVRAVVNILTVLNLNAVNSRLTLVTFNVFGDWTGDLVMPSEMYFSDALSVGNAASVSGSSSTADLSQIKKVVLDINNDNSSTITNNVSTNADTGGNNLQSVPGANGNSGDVRDGAITTGTSSTNTQIQNVSNLTVYNSKLFLALVKVLGNWSGNIYSLPDSVAVDYMPNGLRFVSSSDPAAMQQLQQQLQPTPPPTQTSTDNSNITTCESNCSQTSDTETTVSIDNSNQADITNNVNVNATTGQNNITSKGGDVRNNSIQTGDADILVNIMNFANANLVNADLHIGLVNIFGKWNGNIRFGRPDAAVTQSSTQTEVPAAEQAPVNINVSFNNSADGSLDNSKLEWKYDPRLFSLDSIQSSYAYQEATPGDVIFTLGKVYPNQTSSIPLTLKTLKVQGAGSTSTFFAHIFGTGAETNLTNNQNIFTLTAATPAPEQNNGDNNNSGGSASGNGGGSSGGAGSSGGGGGGGSSGGGGGGGAAVQTNGSSAGQSQGAGIGIVPNLLKIYKSNNAAIALKPGDKVDFTITVDNDGNNTINGLVVYDTLRGPDNSIMSSHTYNIDTMPSRAEVTIHYTLVLSASATPGTYTNAAYVQGLNESLLPVHSQSDALSSFIVRAATSSELKDLAEQDKTKNPDDANKKLDTTQEILTQDNTVRPDGQVLGDNCVQPTFATNLRLGSKGADVKTLQMYLNKNGFLLAKRGVSSPGFETTTFGTLLRAALIKFQKANGLNKEAGIFGDQTRAKINALLNSTGMSFCTPPAKTQIVSKASVTTKITTVKKPSGIKTTVHNVTVGPINSSINVHTSTPGTITTSPKPSKPTSFWSKIFHH